MTPKQPGIKDRVILHHTHAWWIAEFHGPIAAQMRATWGGDTVLTGFNGHIPAPVVCSAIALLNPSAEVALAEQAQDAAPAAAREPARPAPPQPGRADTPASMAHSFWRACFVRASQKAAAGRDAGLAAAAEVVNKHQRAVAEETNPARRLAIERAMKLKRSLGLMVACSYLKEQGWSFEAAHRALLQNAAAPRA